MKKIQTLAQIAADLRQGQHFNITRLTIIKSFCSDPDAAAKFAVYIAKLAQRQFEARRPGGIELNRFADLMRRVLLRQEFHVVARVLSRDSRGIAFSSISGQAGYADCADLRQIGTS